MIPPAPLTKPVAFYDTECYRNLWLLKIRPQGSDVVYTFTLRPGQSFDQATINRICYLFNLFTVVSFNGIYYDVPMIAAALGGYSCEQLKWLSDQIIVHQLKPWELNVPDWKPADHIDIIEVAPGAGSQKQYAGRIHYRTMRDLPYEPDHWLTESEVIEVDAYCSNDLGVLEALFVALTPQIDVRVKLGAPYGLDLRSKSDAQMAEAILKHRCEQALGYRIYKPEVDWNLTFRYEPPKFLSFTHPALVNAFELVKSSLFRLGASGAVEMPEQLKGLEIPIGGSIYRMGIGGLHSSETCRVLKSDDLNVLEDIDVESYYPKLMINSGKHPLALGPTFTVEFEKILVERLGDKRRQRGFEELKIDVKNRANADAYDTYCANEGKKTAINGTFGKTLSHYSVLFAPQMGIQTTVGGQLSILMLIEWHEAYNIPVVSANTDGIVIYCPRNLRDVSKQLIAEWERRTGLKMEASEYAAIYSRDVNNYFAVKTSGEVKRKGEYARAGLVEKKNPDVEICADAAAEFLKDGTPIDYTIAMCRDLRKFVTVRRVTGGGVKMWGEGPRDDMKVKNMTDILHANGWVKVGRKWSKAGVGPDTDYNAHMTNAREAYESCFAPQTPEYMGKVIRWYYSREAPGPIVYANNGNKVGLSYGAKPCMTMPDEFPQDIDYGWYVATAQGMLKEVGLE